MNYTIHPHAQNSMTLRHVTSDALESVIQNPEQAFRQEDGLLVHQSRISGPKKKPHLLRAFIDMNEIPPLVVTVISTSKVRKYWRI